MEHRCLFNILRGGHDRALFEMDIRLLTLKADQKSEQREYSANQRCIDPVQCCLSQYGCVLLVTYRSAFFTVP